MGGDKVYYFSWEARNGLSKPVTLEQRCEEVRERSYEFPRGKRSPHRRKSRCKDLWRSMLGVNEDSREARVAGTVSSGRVIGEESWEKDKGHIVWALWLQ